MENNTYFQINNANQELETFCDQKTRNRILKESESTPIWATVNPRLGLYSGSISQILYLDALSPASPQTGVICANLGIDADTANFFLYKANKGYGEVAGK